MEKRAKIIYILTFAILFFAIIYILTFSYQITGNVIAEPAGVEKIKLINNNPIKIMFLGDSITFISYNPPTYNNEPNYRNLVWNRLKEEGYNVDFVGSMKDNSSLDYDKDNEGHSGWTSSWILHGEPGGYGGNSSIWFKEYNPDIIALHIGINDFHAYGKICSNSSVNSDECWQSVRDSIVSNIGGIIDVARANNPNTIFLIAQITPTAYENVPDSQIRLFNQDLIGLESRESIIDQSPIILVDLYSGFNLKTDSDGVHPLPRAAVKFADKWYAAIKKAIDAYS